VEPNFDQEESKTGEKSMLSAPKFLLWPTLGLCCLGLLSGPSGTRAADAPIVQTDKGPVRGIARTGLDEFRGIPYAKPPAGELRWRPPEEPTAWTGTRDATAFGSNCPQITEYGAFAGPANDNENCLFVNVFTPNLHGTTKLPVLVFVHGGGNINGESSDYDGAAMAVQGNAVVVTLNYRLGLLGFFAHPALDAENHLFGNYGILDQQLALKWVQKNIGAFGGDKDNVTLSGQSAGSKNTIVNLVSPLAAGLFKRVILESLFQEPTPLDYSELLGTRAGVAGGCPSGAGAEVAACLRNLSARQVMALQGTTSTRGANVQNFVADGQISPSEGIVAAIRAGHFHHVPVIGGTTEDEGNFMVGVTEYFSGPPRVAFTPKDYANLVEKTFSGNAGAGGAPPVYPPGTAERVAKEFPVSKFENPQLAMNALVTSTVYACPLHHVLELLSSQVPVYYYEFRDRTAPYYFPDMPGFRPLAAHTTDLQFLFPGYHGGPDGAVRELNKDQLKLSGEMIQLWTNFARNSDPNGDGPKIWSTFNTGADAPILAQDIPALTTINNAAFVAEHRCDFWDKILKY
jgi:para-nitrobenzyl esterase